MGSDVVVLSLKCPDCGEPTSRAAARCVHCGFLVAGEGRAAAEALPNAHSETADQLRRETLEIEERSRVRRIRNAVVGGLAGLLVGPMVGKFFAGIVDLFLGTYYGTPGAVCGGLLGLTLGIFFGRKSM
ncbi:MAG: hypothetical protein AAF481_15920 [Acidobacteriota bacterium]